MSVHHQPTGLFYRRLRGRLDEAQASSVSNSSPRKRADGSKRLVLSLSKGVLIRERLLCI